MQLGEKLVEIYTQFKCVHNLYQLQVLGKHEPTNDTTPIFNWHPIMMSLAFPVQRCAPLFSHI